MLIRENMIHIRDMQSQAENQNSLECNDPDIGEWEANKTLLCNLKYSTSISRFS